MSWNQKGRPNSMGGRTVSAEGYHRTMRVFNGKVINGRVQLPPGSVEDGEAVTIFVSDEDDGFDLTPAQVRELQQSIDQISRGEVVNAEDLLAQLRG